LRSWCAPAARARSESTCFRRISARTPPPMVGTAKDHREKRHDFFHRAQRSIRAGREQLWRERERWWARARPPLSPLSLPPPRRRSLCRAPTGKESRRGGRKEWSRFLVGWRAAGLIISAQSPEDRSRRISKVEAPVTFFARVLV
jgi:hypothetical protein